MQHYIIQIKKDSSFKIISEKNEISQHVAKCIVISMDEGDTITLVIGWDLFEEEYLHDDIYSKILDNFPKALIFGGGILNPIGKTMQILDKSVQYGEMDATHVAFYATKLNADIGYPYSTYLDW